MMKPIYQIRTMAFQHASAALAAVPLIVSACATTPATKELKDARDAYAEAKQHPTSGERPDELVDARDALEAAEAAHESDPGSENEKHLAYIAERRAQLAMSRADKTAADRLRASKESSLLSNAKQYADTTQKRLEDTQNEVSKTQEELEMERQKRKEAEQMANAALQDLKRVAMVKEEARGFVITLSGAVLFESGKSELLHTAKKRLEEVAKALDQQGENKQIVVEGHTDSRGSDSYNEELSLARAKAVTDFLTQQGIASERLQAKGVGEEEPIADNGSPEGRANNRRVEIIVQSEAPDKTVMR